jgi:uncharacterized protein with HEPN domain
MRLETKFHLEDVRLAAKTILRMTAGQSSQDYMRSEAVRGSVKYHYTIIAEAVS